MTAVSDLYTRDEVCEAIAEALHAGDLPAVIDLMHILALKDPQTADLLMQVFTGKLDADQVLAVLGGEQ